MKKVRFETYEEHSGFSVMGNPEEFVCHTPRPFMSTNIQPIIQKKSNYDIMNFTPETVEVIEMFDNSDVSPYSPVDKTKIQPSFVTNNFLASDNLELSILDTNDEGPQMKTYSRAARNGITPVLIHERNVLPSPVPNLTPEKSPLTSVENVPVIKPSPVDVRDHSFFLNKENLKSSHVNPLNKRFLNCNIGKENMKLHKNAEFMKIQRIENGNRASKKLSPRNPCSNGTICCCHTCQYMGQQQQQFCHHMPHPRSHQAMTPSNMLTPQNFHCMQYQQQFSKCCSEICTTKDPDIIMKPGIAQGDQPIPQNAIEKKEWAIKQHELNKTGQSTKLAPVPYVAEACSSPSVSDLYQIIKMQSEQLQLLQEKVDKFLTITSDNSTAQNVPRIPAEVYTARQVAVESIQNDKISIGVMTSLEMVRTSTVINKEVYTQNQNSQIQCNKSQISIKEISYKGAGTRNFLDGIMKGGNSMQSSKNTVIENDNMSCKATDHCRDGVDDKLVNELSLCNINVENATTPLISPDQTMYLDVRDYSNSESSSDDHSNVGWTYYNKVMTQVNGMLQDSDMPSSASAMLRRARQQCLQMHIDKTNVSVTKRVKFNSPTRAEPAAAAVTDTSLRMQQLAAKYLPAAFEYQSTARECQIPAREYQIPAREYQIPAREYQIPAREYQIPAREYQNPAPEYQPTARIPQCGPDMSFATRNYMERHQLLNGVPRPPPARSPPPAEMPRFLDITALKRQPKLL